MSTTKRILQRSTMAFVIGLAGAIAVMMPSAARADRTAVPPLGSQRILYPVAFQSYMAVNYGPVWMHTVQEEVVRRIYVSWLAKEQPKSDDKDKH
ncbi:MAG: hypothetical protein EXS03_09435 [Phycisphaerales bacterium]|nr:hypothetical protein [Phycisphaerales bacterium]